MIKSLKSKKNIILRNPSATRPWQHVLEPLSGYLSLGQKLIDKELKSNIHPCWNFGPYKRNCKKVLDIVKLLVKDWQGNKTKIFHRKNKKFHESKLLSLNIYKAKKELKWQPRLDLDETIRFTIDWYKNFLSGDEVEDITNYQIEYFIDK